MATLHKVQDRRRLSKLIQEYIDNAPEVRPFPTSVTRLLAAFDDPNANSRVFESIIECDPALAVRILRLANSPLFGLSSKVNSVAHAASLLGTKKLKSLAMSVAGATMFSEGNSAELQRQRLWCHSVACALLARKLAEYVPGVNTEDAFLAGIFHDVGKLLFYDVVPAEYSEIESEFHGLDLIREEEFVLGITHERVGLASSHSWDLAKELKTAIGWHHQPDSAPTHADIARTIGFADSLAKYWGIGSDVIDTEDVPNMVGERLNLTESKLSEIQEQIGEEFKEAMQASHG